MLHREQTAMIFYKRTSISSKIHIVNVTNKDKFKSTISRTKKDMVLSRIQKKWMTKEDEWSLK